MQMGLYCILIGEMKFSFVKKMKMKVILTIEDNSFQIISLNASFSLQREFFTYMCHENISSQPTTICGFNVKEWQFYRCWKDINWNLHDKISW